MRVTQRDSSCRSTVSRYPCSARRRSRPGAKNEGERGRRIPEAQNRKGNRHMATEAAQSGTSQEVPPDVSEHLTTDDRVGLLRAMLMMRGIEERAMTLYRQGKVPGSFYDGFGQEAVSAGPAWAMAAADRLCILHRDLAAHVIRGVRDRADLRPVHGPRGRHHRRARRQRALRRPHQGLRRDGLDAPRHDADRDRARDGVQDARRGARRDDVVRRRLDLARRLPRGDELGGRPAAAGHLHPREQPVRLLDAGRPAVRDRPRRARGGLRLPGRQGRRQRLSRRRSRSPARRASARWPARARR